MKRSKAGRKGEAFRAGKGSRKKIDIAKTSKQKAGITKSPDKLAAAGDITRDIYPFNTA